MLANAVEGALRPGQTITWTDADGDAMDLTGATVTGYITNVATEVSQTIGGTCTVAAGAQGSAGVFTWTYGTADVAAAGVYRVQFNAAFAVGVSPARTFAAVWTVEPFEI